MKKIKFRGVHHAKSYLDRAGLQAEYPKGAADKNVEPVSPPKGYLFICANQKIPLEIGTLRTDGTLEFYNEDAPFVKNYHEKLLEEVSGVKCVTVV